MIEPYNPRYLAYCRANRMASPEDMMLHDYVRFPGGVMCGFILWMHDKGKAFRKLKGYDVGEPLSEDDQQEFGAWLEAAADHESSQS